MAPFHRRPWSRREEELLGTMRDEKLARRLGRSVGSVAWRRAVRGIRICDPKKHHWRLRSNGGMGRMGDMGQMAFHPAAKLGEVSCKRRSVQVSSLGR